MKQRFLGDFSEDIMVDISVGCTSLYTEFSVASNAADFATFDAALFNVLLEGES